MDRTKIKHWLNKKTILEFIRYNLASLVFFWSTLGLFAVFDYLTNWPTAYQLGLASLIAHGIYFWLSRNFIFSKYGQRRTAAELWRFGIFMGLNYFINIGIVTGLETLGINPYIGQFMAAGFFMFWTYFWFKFWVFKKVKNVGRR